jgi:hypothetical protein
MGDNSSSGNGGLDQSIQLFISTNGKLKMSWSDTLHLKILAGVSCQLKNFSSKVLKDSRGVYSSRGSHTLRSLNRGFKETVYTTYRELKSGLGRS